MILITPERLFRSIGSGEYKSFLANLLPSVPTRTRRNLKNGAKPSQKTQKSIIEDVCAATSLDEDMVRSFLTQQSSQPWKSFFTGLKKGMGERYCPSFDYCAEIIVKIESTPFKAAAYKKRKNPRWRDQLKKTGLPKKVVPDSFWETFYRIHQKKNVQGEGQVNVPVELGEVVLRVNLFVLAAFEVSLMNSNLFLKDAGMWIHKLIPYYTEENELVEPIKLFFKAIMDNLKLSSVNKFAEQIPPLTISNKQKDIDSQKRQLRRWMSGKVLPSWENMRLIGDTFWDEEKSAMGAYGVTRFLQSFLRDFRSDGIPVFFKDEKAIVSIFHEYSDWQKYHEKGFAKWDVARNHK